MTPRGNRPTYTDLRYTLVAPVCGSPMTQREHVCLYVVALGGRLHEHQQEEAAAFYAEVIIICPFVRDLFVSASVHSYACVR